MKHAWSYAPLLVLLMHIAGCEDGDVEAKQRQMAIQCYNSYGDNRRAAEIFRRKAFESSTPDEANLYLGRCRIAVDRVTPFEPLDVDQGLARAISEYRAAAIANVEVAARVLHGDSVAAANAQAALALEGEAIDKVEAEFNRVAARLGGITREPPS